MIDITEPNGIDRTEVDSSIQNHLATCRKEVAACIMCSYLFEMEPSPATLFYADH